MSEEKSNLSINISSGNASKIKNEYEEVFNNSNSSNSINFYPNKLSKKIKLKKRYFMCCGCRAAPQLDFKDNELDLTCDCKEISNLRIKGFIDNYSYQKKEEVEFYLSCKVHKQNIYKCYCLVCNKNLCEECLKITKLHDNHSINNFFSVKNNKEVDSLKELIRKKREKLNKGDKDIREKLNLFEGLINSYNEFPCHNLYESIKSAKSYLEKFDIKEIIERLKITKEKGLIDNKKKSFLISYINISKQNFNNLSIFKELDLSNLKILVLNENCITNIDPLLCCNFKELETFEIERNKLNYKSMENFDKMNFPNIKFINLFRNEIESIKIFEKVLNFKTLEKFHVGENKFKKEEIIQNGNKTYNLNFLLNIGLTGNFTKETIYFTLNLNLINLEYLYLNRNNLTSLDILKDFELPNLKSFWAIENQLIDYNGLSKLKYKNKMERINLKDNKIKKIDDLLQFISNFEKLNLLILVNNEIDWDKPINNKLLEDINNKYKKLKLIIEITEENKIYLEEDL